MSESIDAHKGNQNEGGKETKEGMKYTKEGMLALLNSIAEKGPSSNPPHYEPYILEDADAMVRSYPHNWGFGDRREFATKKLVALVGQFLQGEDVVAEIVNALYSVEYIKKWGVNTSYGSLGEYDFDSIYAAAQK